MTVQISAYRGENQAVKLAASPRKPHFTPVNMDENRAKEGVIDLVITRRITTNVWIFVALDVNNLSSPSKKIKRILLCIFKLCIFLLRILRLPPIYLTLKFIYA
jgi:hypothetical protein